jgi:hypothetical protein
MGMINADAQDFDGADIIMPDSSALSKLKNIIIAKIVIVISSLFVVLD